jgi:hypothetical protein
MIDIDVVDVVGPDQLAGVMVTLQKDAATRVRVF